MNLYDHDIRDSSYFETVGRKGGYRVSELGRHDALEDIQEVIARSSIADRYRQALILKRTEVLEKLKANPDHFEYRSFLYAKLANIDKAERITAAYGFIARPASSLPKGGLNSGSIKKDGVVYFMVRVEDSQSDLVLDNSALQVGGINSYGATDETIYTYPFFTQDVELAKTIVGMLEEAGINLSSPEIMK